MTLITRVSIKVKSHLFPACQITDLKRWHRIVSYRLTHLNLKGIYENLKYCVKNSLALILLG